jgi:hypothetical protein
LTGFVPKRDMLAIKRLPADPEQLPADHSRAG